ncbi:MAG: GGDEF domain-containing protein [Cyanobacteria bacterium SIG32]|nr:GGDEF domain-containing protein [Cyanobacteria bacterium SIG32]
MEMNMEERRQNNLGENFDIPASVLDEIQKNIEDIILNFDIPEGNKIDVIKKINFMYSQTRFLSVTDSLTGLYNRRHFEDTLEREFLRASRYKNNLSFAIIDVDFFKKVNDTYGHSTGDYVLKEVAYLILQNLRKTDMVFRYGGEEFAVIITETPKEKAIVPLERLRKAVEEYPFSYNGQDIKITISIGISEVCENITTVHQLFDDADRALYKAKENGRNQIQINL